MCSRTGSCPGYGVSSVLTPSPVWIIRSSTPLTSSHDHHVVSPELSPGHSPANVVLSPETCSLSWWREDKFYRKTGQVRGTFENIFLTKPDLILKRFDQWLYCCQEWGPGSERVSVWQHWLGVWPAIHSGPQDPGGQAAQGESIVKLATSYGSKVRLEASDWSNFKLTF